MRFVKMLTCVFLEMGACLFILLCLPIGWFPGRKTKCSLGAQDANPVLLIHGYLVNRSNFLMLQRRLRRDGYRCIHTINLWPPWASIPQFSSLVKDKVEKIICETRASKIDIIAHSMGGLVARYYVKRLGGGARVNRCISLGTPHHGSKLALLSFGRCGRQMIPHSSFLIDLNSGGASSNHVSCVCIYSPHDEFIFPHNSAVLPPPAKIIKLDYLGHASLLLCLRSYKAIKRSLGV